MTSPVFQVTPGTGLKILFGGRTVVDTAGSLVLGTAAANDYTATGVAMTFPDFTKQWLYCWRFAALCTNNGPSAYTFAERGTAYMGALPGTTTTSTILCAAPAGANFAFGLVRINRTSTPSTWAGTAIAVKPTTNVWIPINGSIVVEEQVGMSRKFSLIISGGNLVLVQQQSIGAPPYWAVSTLGGAVGTRTMAVSNYSGSVWPQLPSFPTLGVTYQGCEWALQTEGVPYFPCYAIGEAALGGTVSAIDTTTRRTTANGFVGSAAQSVTDPTNYQSTYTLDFDVKFCKAA